MAKLWRPFARSGTNKYNFRKLIDSRVLDPVQPDEDQVQIICDIDKTYLETEFDSVFSMARIAFEAPEAKVTVAGAKEVLLRLRWSPNMQRLAAPLHFVSSSPPQLRPVLEEKLTMDGLDWNSDTFKNQVYNVLKGRMDLLRQHVAYKSGAILSLMQRSTTAGKYYLIGDNAESDPFIYMGVYLYTKGLISTAGYQRYLGFSGIEESTLSDFEKMFPLPPAGEISGIMIRNTRKRPQHDPSPLSIPIRFFDNFFQAALILINSDLLATESLWPLSRKFHNLYGHPRRDLLACLQEFKTSAKTKSIEEACDETIARLSIISPLQKPRRPKIDFTPCDFSKITNLSEDRILAHAQKWSEKFNKKK